MASERRTRSSQLTSAELLWGARSRPSRGPRPGLSLELIAATAIEIADEEGLDALSMQRVAGRLNYTAMSLYRYVPSKEHLIDVVYDTAIGQPPQAADDDADETGKNGENGAGGEGNWRAEVDRWVRALLRVYADHPWLLRIAAHSPPLGPNQLAWFDALLRHVSGIGLSEDEMVHLVLFVTGAVRDLARTSTELAQATDQSGLSVEQVGAGYAEAMKRFTDADRLPTLARIVSAGIFEPSQEPYNDILPSLEFGLQRLLDGVESYVHARRRR